jgi:hypothetical protein
MQTIKSIKHKFNKYNLVITQANKKTTVVMTKEQYHDVNTTFFNETNMFFFFIYSHMHKF